MPYMREQDVANRLGQVLKNIYVPDRKPFDLIFERAKNEDLVGARGFEPRTPCAQGRCATRLRYAPT